MSTAWWNIIAVAVGTYGVATPILQDIYIRLSSKHPKTTKQTKEFLTKERDRDVMAVPCRRYLPFRIIANFAIGLSLIPSILLVATTVGLPLYAVQYVVGPYFQEALGVFALLALLQAYLHLRAPKCEPGDDLPPPTKKKVGIIGAGCSGLCVAKEMVAEGHEPVVFEKTSAVGGLWQRGEGASERTALVLEETYTSSSALNTAFSDFPIQPEFGGNETFCMSQHGFMKYIDAYAEHFGLKKHIELNTEVMAVRRNVAANKWEVTIRQNKKETTHEFDLIAVCSGQANIPNVPTIKGQEYFKGNIRHSTGLRDPEQMANIYTGKRVLCVGQGETASDNARSVAKHAARCDLSIRDAVLVLLRNLWGAHPDYTEHRSMLSCPPWLRWAVYKICCTTFFPFNWTYARTWAGKLYELPSCLLHWKLLFTPKYLYECLTLKRSFCASIQITKTENFLYIINGDTSKIQPGVDHINEAGEVVFKDRTIGQYDEILFNTGFQPNKFPFLPPGFNDGVSHTREDRYLAMIHPQLPDMAFIGFARGQVGSLVLGFELQARWFALLASGKREWPSQCEMKRSIAEGHLKKDCNQYTRATWIYANYLARYHVKCEPNLMQFFLQDPVACLKAYFGAPTGYLYRMRGPHANPKAALEGYGLTTSAMLYVPPIWALHHPLWLLSGWACEYFWSRLPIVGPLFRPTLDNYY